MLLPDGIFALKLDLTTLAEYGPAYDIPDGLIAACFRPTSIPGLESETLITDHDERYRFVLLRKH